MSGGDFEEERWEADVTADTLVLGLFGETGSQRSSSSKKRRTKTTAHQVPDKKQKLSKFSQDNLDVQPSNHQQKCKKDKTPKGMSVDKNVTHAEQSITPQSENKKSRRNKYKHLSIASKSQRDLSSGESKQSAPAENGAKKLTGQGSPYATSKIERSQRKISSAKSVINSEQTSHSKPLASSKPNKRNKYKHLANRSASETGMTVEDKINDNVSVNNITPGTPNIHVRKGIAHGISQKTHPSEQNVQINDTKDRKRVKKNENGCNGKTNQVKMKRDVKKEEISNAQTNKVKEKRIKAVSQSPSNVPAIDNDTLRTSPSHVDVTCRSNKKMPFKVDRIKNILRQEECAPVTPTSHKRDKSQGLRERMLDQLKSARFRYLNEQLYTTSGTQAYEMFQEDAEAFSVYHEGFQSQVHKWPENPLDKMVQYIKARPSSLVVADFGCGDASLALQLSQRVHSFDLVALNSRVTACDMANVPLDNGSVDVAVFCLSLMGTNLLEYILEARRVLKKGGVLLVAEVVSRFDKVGSFARKMQKIGFILLNKDEDNKMFIWLEFKKAGKIDPDLLPSIELQPCVYKRR